MFRALVAGVMLMAVSATHAEDLMVIAWNVESGGAGIGPITDRVAKMDGVDLWGLSEVRDQSWCNLIEKAAGDGEDAEFDAILGSTGGDDRLAIVYDTSELELLDQTELSDINPGGRVRSPLAAHFKYKPTGHEFVFVVNHLYRGSAEGRHQQARMLNTWARTQTLPIICCGDFNFDWSVANDGRSHDPGFDYLTADGVFEWLRPDRIIKTQDSKYNSILDFIFVTKTASFRASDSSIIVVPGDFPDTAATPDHRPVTARFAFEGEPTENGKPDAAVADGDTEALRKLIADQERSLNELRVIAEQLEESNGRQRTKKRRVLGHLTRLERDLAELRKAVELLDSR